MKQIANLIAQVKNERMKETPGFVQHCISLQGLDEFLISVQNLFP